MATARRKQNRPYITERINHADNKSKLIEKLCDELFSIGAYTRADLNSQVIPLIQENAEDIYSMKELVLKKSEAKGKITERKENSS
jgi:hypothetical protein